MKELLEQEHSAEEIVRMLEPLLQSVPNLREKLTELVATNNKNSSTDPGLPEGLTPEDLRQFVKVMFRWVRNSSKRRTETREGYFFIWYAHHVLKKEKIDLRRFLQHEVRQRDWREIETVLDLGLKAATSASVRVRGRKLAIEFWDALPTLASEAERRRWSRLIGILAGTLLITPTGTAAASRSTLKKGLPLHLALLLVPTLSLAVAVHVCHRESLVSTAASPETSDVAHPIATLSNGSLTKAQRLLQDLSKECEFEDLIQENAGDDSEDCGTMDWRGALDSRCMAHHYEEGRNFLVRTFWVTDEEILVAYVGKWEDTTLNVTEISYVSRAEGAVATISLCEVEDFPRPLGPTPLRFCFTRLCMECKSERVQVCARGRRL